MPTHRPPAGWPRASLGTRGSRRSTPSSSASSPSSHSGPVCAVPRPGCRRAVPPPHGDAGRGSLGQRGAWGWGPRRAPQGPVGSSACLSLRPRARTGLSQAQAPWAPVGGSFMGVSPARSPATAALGGRATCQAGRGGTSGAAAQALPGPPRSLTAQGPAAASGLARPAQQGHRTRPGGEGTAPGLSSDLRRAARGHEATSSGLGSRIRRTVSWQCGR